MGYDMSIESPDPAVIEPKNKLYDHLYGKDGLFSLRNKIPKEEWGTPVDAMAWMPTYPEGYVADSGTAEWRNIMQEIANTQAEYAPLEAQTYFRLNIHGMSVCASFMWERGMIADLPQPQWPRIEDHGLDDWPDSDQKWPPDSKEARYLAACDQVRDGEHPDTPGIPDYKFGSNDGWLVTPSECLSALEQHKKWCEEKGIDPLDDRPQYKYEDGLVEVQWWQKWLMFLDTAAYHGGFRVW